MSRAALLIALGFCSCVFASFAVAQTDQRPASPLTTWGDVLEQFRHAARRAQAGRVAEAQAVLQAIEATGRPPYAQHAAFVASPLSGAFSVANEPPTYRTSIERARAAEQLAEYEIALVWAKLAGDLAEPAARSGSYRQVAWLLAATDRLEESLEAYDRVIAEPGPFSSQHEIKQLLERKARIKALQAAPQGIQVRIDFIRQEFLEGIPIVKRADRLLSALERLVPMLEQTKDPAERRQIHRLMQTCFLELNNFEGLAAWEDAMLAESWLTVDDRAGIASQRADLAHKMRQFAVAEKQWRLICTDYSTSHHYGTAQFNLGFVLQEQGKYDAAIAEYVKLFPSKVNDRDPGSNIMQAYRNYRNSAAKQLSKCYEAKDDARKALDWAIQARDTYRYQSWCGTCMEQEAAATTANLIRLKHKAGERAEALRMAEDLVFGKRAWIEALHVPQLIAEEYFEQGRTDELLERVEKFRQDRFDRLKESHQRSGDKNPFDGHTGNTRFIVDCVEVLQLDAKNDPAQVWDWIQSRDVTALEALIPANPRQAAVGLAAKRLLADRNSAVPFLLERFRANEYDRDWAVVLLAQLGEVKNVEALHRLAASIDQGSSYEDRKRASRRQANYFYAVLIADPTARAGLFERYSNTNLVYPAQNAMYRDREVRDLALFGGE
jgi:tetratricopeptide (TPR) repeat protein